jgi:hypothetical protein
MDRLVAGLSEEELELIDFPRGRAVTKWLVPLQTYERRETTWGDGARYG